MSNISLKCCITEFIYDLYMHLYLKLSSKIKITCAEGNKFQFRANREVLSGKQKTIILRICGADCSCISMTFKIKLI